MKKYVLTVLKRNSEVQFFSIKLLTRPNLFGGDDEMKKGAK